MGFHLMNIAEYCVKILTNLDYCLLELSEAFMFLSTMEILGKLNLNLPLTPIRDLRIQKREKDLIVATHGRAFGY
jgi:hypothetical protein